MLSNTSVYAACAGGKYPDFSIYKKKNKLFDPSQIAYTGGGIHGVIPSPNFNIFAFLANEVGNPGLILYDYEKKKPVVLLKEYYIESLKWLDNKIIVVEKYKINTKAMTEKITFE